MKRWPWSKAPKDSPDDGAHAHGAAQEALEQAKAQRPMVNEVASTLRNLRSDDFTAAIAASMRRRK